jgi:hypothetical protein
MNRWNIFDRKLHIKRVNEKSFRTFIGVYFLFKNDLLLYQFTERVTKLTVIIIVRYNCYQLHTNVIEYPPLKVKSVHK